MGSFTVIIGDERHAFKDVDGKEVKLIYDNGESGDNWKRNEVTMSFGASDAVKVLYEYIYSKLTEKNS